MQPEIITGLAGASNSIYNTQINKVPAKMVIGGISPAFTNQTQNYFNRNTSDKDLSKEFGLNVKQVNVPANKKEIDIF
jgi:hypothetical protein